jgi:hypothetical protein
MQINIHDMQINVQNNGALSIFCIFCVLQHIHLHMLMKTQYNCSDSKDKISFSSSLVRVHQAAA